MGTPSVSVSSSGPDTAKNFTFAFRNLKGETGVTSVLATVDNTSGNPQCAVSLNGQQLVLNFTGLKGAQGDTGSSVDYPFTIVNNLTTNDATQALSAAMGVQLETEVSQLEAKVTDLQTISKDASEIWTKRTNTVIGTDGALSNSSNYITYVFESSDFKKVTGNGSSYVGFPVLAFYNGTPSAATLISKIDATTAYQNQAFSENIPSGTTHIAVGQYVNATTAYATLSKEIDLTGTIKELTDDAASLHFADDVFAGRDLVGYSVLGYLKADGTWGDASTVRSIKEIPLRSGDVLRMTGITDLTGISSIVRLVYEDGTQYNIAPSSQYVDNYAAGCYDITMPPGVSIKYAYPMWLSSLSDVKCYYLIFAENAENTRQWNTKIWAGLGDSLTAQQYDGLSWSPMVEAATGLSFKNCGVGSTCLAGSANTAFWKRLSTVEGYNPDLVTILGGANDLYSDIPIGTDAEFSKTIANKDCNTFIGAYSYIIETLLTWKKTLRIVLLTTSYAHNDGADHTPGIGLTYKDYANATLRVAEYYGLPVVDLYRNMGLNKLTQDSTYTRGDNIHWNARASQIVASLVIAKLNEINNAIPTE